MTIRPAITKYLSLPKWQLTETMDYLRMDGKQGHVTCGNR